MLYPVILCGGSGSRLWPLSREAYPKQFLDLTQSGQSMLQMTLLRLQGLSDIAAPLAICNQEHRFLVAEQLHSIDSVPAGILLEPVARNTAPAVALAAFSALEADPDALLLVLPADHCIGDIAAFQAGVDKAREAAEAGYLVTFGIIPEAAETGYGYIERGEALASVTGAFGIKRFVEKPDKANAERYLADENFTWNSGMFLFRADQFLAELEQHAPAMHSACQQAYKNAYRDLDFTRIEEQAFTACPSDSIDYAVMEKTTKGAMVPLDAGWNDVGSWSAIWDISNKDADGNVVVGDALVQDSSNSLVYSDSRLVTTLGLSDTVVVETADAVLVADKSRVQDVKSLVVALKQQSRDEGAMHKVVYRPWGSYESICASERFQVKQIIVNPGQKLSLQMHHHRAEHWIVVSGTAEVTCEDKVADEDKVFTLKEDQSTYIPLGHRHRLANPGKMLLKLIEVQSGSYLGEDDIIRFDDDYGRDK
ncbi:MAG TPA: mannose-1-phosphate guanylyltransferase/mannose-6-phosphate isomerase [Cellvibrionales bacterium]|nr:mannose-1-phosphate guanylyltransferase/mannose-6-phosphate isomerase [Cellvibrionales bacterium]HCX27182.1 mannose-1-phosphate guanylyltransferase/mannose-6-phosphate isomerase [Cellvibrionales bacterium]